MPTVSLRQLRAAYSRHPELDYFDITVRAARRAAARLATETAGAGGVRGAGVLTRQHGGRSAVPPFPRAVSRRKVPIMSKPATARVTLTRLRQLAHHVLLTEGAAIAPGAQTPEAIDDAIGALANQLRPDVERDRDDRDALLSDITDRDLVRRVSDHDGTIMAAYGDAGYFVGVAMGLELAALTFCQLAKVPAIRTPRVRKGGRR
jgi:hypothetical protein